jgi:hypothetical protein
MLAALEPVIVSLEKSYPSLDGPRLPARLNFAGSGEFTGAQAWSMMSVGGPTKEAKREKPVSNLSPDPETALVNVKSSANTRTIALVLAAFLVAITALIVVLIRTPLTAPAADVGEMIAVISPDLAEEQAAEPVGPEVEVLNELPNVVASARNAVSAATLVPAGNRWSVAARNAAAGTVHIVVDGTEGPGLSLPVTGVFGPRQRPVRVVVRLDDGTLRQTIDEAGSVELTDLRISRARANDSSEPAEDAPRPGSLSIRRP